MSSADQVLDLLVLHESQVVTYRRLSRELNVHVNTAKQLLADFHAANKGRCHATYFVTGFGSTQSPSATASMPKIHATLVPEAMLPDAQNALVNPSSHVYSLEARALDDPAAYVMANVQTGSNRDIASLGAIRSSTTRVAGPPGKSVDQSSSLSVPILQPKSMPSDVKPDSESQNKDTDKEDEPPAKPKPKPSAAPSKSAKLFFGRVKTVKKERSQKETQSEDSQQTNDTQSEESQQTNETQDMKSQLIDETVQSDADFEMQSVEGDANDNDKAEALKLVEGMFDDDDDDDDDDDGDNSPMKVEPISNDPSDSGIASPAKNADSDAEMMGDDSDNNTDSQAPVKRESETAASSNASSSEQNGGRQRVHKRRKVSKIKHSKNKRGMLVSQVVDEWESYSESESDDAHKSSAMAVSAKHINLKKDQSSLKEEDLDSSSKKTKTAGAPPQRSILSFFGKKK